MAEHVEQVKVEPISDAPKTEQQAPATSCFDSETPAYDQRIRGLVCQIPIIYGNVTHRFKDLEAPNLASIHMPKEDVNNTTASRLDGYDWFRWTVYVRGAHNEDLSYFIKRVVFVLHSTYVHPIRIVDRPPFELTEVGWGSFEVKIEVHFHSLPPSMSSPPPVVSAAAVAAEHIQSPMIKNRKRTFSEMTNETTEHGTETENENANDAIRRNIWLCPSETVQTMLSRKTSQIMDMFNASDGLPNEPDSDTNSTSSETSSVVGFENKVVFLHSLVFEHLDVAPQHGSTPHTAIDASRASSEDGIVAEKYSIIEFHEPYYYLYERLMLGPQRTANINHPFYEMHWKKCITKVAHAEQRLIQAISKCHRKLMPQIEDKIKEYLTIANEN